MTDKELLDRLGLRLMSSRARIRDLERENHKLKNKIIFLETKELSNKAIEATKN